MSGVTPTVDWHATTCILEYHSFVRLGALSPSPAVFPSASDLSSFPRFLVSTFPHFLVSRFTIFDPIPDPVPVRLSHSDPLFTAAIPIPRSHQRFRSPFRLLSRLPSRFPFRLPFLAAALLAASHYAPALRCFIKKAALDHGQSLG